MKTLIKELIFCLAILLCVVVFAHAQTPSPTFELVKQTALKASPDKNGDYFFGVVVDDIEYVCGYMPRLDNSIGIRITNQTTKIMSIVLWDGETGLYGRRVSNPETNIVLDVLLNQETADMIAKRVLEYFGEHKSI